ncbi:hypothetical protein HanXRQr2_Chr09g0405861 [Helianthus annuus]|uniref:Uncharacterized protein n=1 Tax=Helianthus annuus TaxID=4232 RepID=A0A9K3N9Y4_HELAN|nr:hypothetical protein HanXRQr2_Chr09g0405861 [Helianthus annuus]KAJ0894684.1 hypothetical protein HanPSC8_Chr09g0391781 [Helianthus annuus]
MSINTSMNTWLPSSFCVDPPSILRSFNHPSKKMSSSFPVCIIAFLYPPTSNHLR